MGGFYDPNVYANNPYDDDKSFKPAGGAGGEFDDEPPLLEGKMFDWLFFEK